MQGDIQDCASLLVGSSSRPPHVLPPANTFKTHRQPRQSWPSISLSFLHCRHFNPPPQDVSGTRRAGGPGWEQPPSMRRRQPHINCLFHGLDLGFHSSSSLLRFLKEIPFPIREKQKKHRSSSPTSQGAMKKTTE